MIAMPWCRHGMPKRLTLGVLLSMVKSPRNSLVSYLYNRRKSPDLSGLREDLSRGDAGVLCVVAFNLPWAVDLMIRSCKRHLPDWRLVIFDNSNKPALRTEIAEICHALGVPYLSLPRNPEWSPNRSHALALNWIYANVIKVVRPTCFGFLDHDCFPFASAPLLEMISRQAAYGFRRNSKFVPEAWNHWAGYMFFNTELIANYSLDFNHDQIRILDTGGRNWVKFYRHLDESRLAKAEITTREVHSLDGSQVYKTQCLDSVFLHIGGASYRDYGDGLKDFIPALRAFIEASLK